MGGTIYIKLSNICDVLLSTCNNISARFRGWQVIILPLANSNYKIIIYLYLPLFLAGFVRYMPPNQQRRGMRSTAVMTAMVWLCDFTDRFGEKLPMNNKIHLPSCLTRASIYKYMKEEVESTGGSVCSQSHFFRVWRKEMPNVTIPKVTRYFCTVICLVMSFDDWSYQHPILHYTSLIIPYLTIYDIQYIVVTGRNS